MAGRSRIQPRPYCLETQGLSRVRVIGGETNSRRRRRGVGQHRAQRVASEPASHDGLDEAGGGTGRKGVASEPASRDGLDEAGGGTGLRGRARESLTRRARRGRPHERPGLGGIRVNPLGGVPSLPATGAPVPSRGDSGRDRHRPYSSAARPAHNTGQTTFAFGERRLSGTC